MLAALRRYARWLHTGWPAGSVEPLPIAAPDGSTRVPGLYLVGDLLGIPLLKFAADSGARAVATIVADPRFAAQRAAPPPAAAGPSAHAWDLVIVGGGVAGMSAALAARAAGLSFVVLEASEPFSTIVNFPRAKPIYTYPSEMTPAGELRFTERSAVKEGLLEELRDQARAAGIVPWRVRALSVRPRDGWLEVALAADRDSAGGGIGGVWARRVIMAVGRSGDFRRLGVAGEELPKVANRLHDPHDFAGKDVLVVGGGDSALEAALALAESGARVILAHRGDALTRPKPANLERLEHWERSHAAMTGRATPTEPTALEKPAAPETHTAPEKHAALTEHTAPRAHTAPGVARPAGQLDVQLSTRVARIEERTVTLTAARGDAHGDARRASRTVPNDAVFTLIGRAAPLELLRRSGVPIRGDWGARRWMGLLAVLLACVFVYHWKTAAGLPVYEWFKARHWFPFGLSPPLDPRTLGGTLGISMTQPSFYYSVAYCAVVAWFGMRRIRRRKTAYVRAQTWTLVAIQAIPLFVLPYVVLPWVGHNAGWAARYEVISLDGDEAARWQAVRAEHPEARFGDGVLRLPHDVQAGATSPQSAHLRDWTAVVRLEARGGGRIAVRPQGEQDEQDEQDEPDAAGAADGGFSAAAAAASPERPGEILIDPGARQALLSFPTVDRALLAQLFPRSEWDPQGREYWRSLGFVLAWPLFFWNVFTGKPMWLWLALSALQTLVLIPLLVRRWGKGAYCGWICSCGALAETLGDAHRHKMPHGPRWNRLNLLGQAILALATVLLLLRVIGWLTPWDSWVNQAFRALFEGKRVNGAAFGFPTGLLNYVWAVDLVLAGILGVGLYFHFSGRTWCRFACPLAALMHIYARFSRFRILAEKKKCISCGVCTAVCHQGIDVMSFANKGQPMADVQCVRCSACVQMCPTGVLEFGAVDPRSGAVVRRDGLAASTVRVSEGRG